MSMHENRLHVGNRLCAERSLSNRRRFTGRVGFSLVELLIVVAVIGILLAILTPAYRRALAKIDGPVVAALQMQPGGKCDLYSMNADGSDKVNLTAGLPGDACQPEISPDGRTVAFNMTSSSGVNRLWITGALGDQEVIAKPAIDLVGWYDDWTLLYLLQPGSGQAQLWKVSIYGTNDQMIARTFNGMNKVTGAAVHPDRTRMAWTWNPGYNAYAQDVYLVDTDGGNPMAFSTLSGSEANPNWTREGDVLYWRYEPSSGSGAYTIMAKGIKGVSPARMLPKNYAGMDFYGLSWKEDRFLCGMTWDTPARLVSFDVQTGAEVEITRAVRVSGAAWARSLVKFSPVRSK